MGSENHVQYDRQAVGLGELGRCFEGQNQDDAQYSQNIAHERDIDLTDVLQQTAWSQCFRSWSTTFMVLKFESLEEIIVCDFGRLHTTLLTSVRAETRPNQIYFANLVFGLLDTFIMTRSVASLL